MNKRQKMKRCAQRRLRCEPLESRQLLHGGGFAGASVEDRVEGLFEKLDGDTDGQLSAAEVSEGIWSRLSEADADESGDVSQDELVTHIEAQLSLKWVGIARGDAR